MTTLHRVDGVPFWSPKCEDPIKAINFALDFLDDHWDRLEFLKSWREGDVSEWPEFFDFNEQETR